jgi:hypothetical protein
MSYGTEKTETRTISPSQTGGVRMKIPCNDCRKNIAKSGDWYLCKDKIWKRLGLGERDNLCIPCLDKRLGREARFPQDIVSVPVWSPEIKTLSPELKKRFGGATAPDRRSHRSART